MSDEHGTRVVAHFSGRVQGVGFRYTVLQLARGFEVAGVVQNLADGRVRLDVEGSRQEIEALIEAVQNQMSGYIRDVAIDDKTERVGHRGFTIR